MKRVKAGTADLEIRFEEGVSIEGIVLGGEDGHEMPVQVTATSWTHGGRREESFGTWSDAEGRFRLLGLLPGPYHLSVRPKDLSASTLTVDAPARDVRFVLPSSEADAPPLSTIEGKINLPVGAAVPEGIWVRATLLDGSLSQGASPQRDGSFRVRRLPPGRYRLTCQRHGGESGPAVEAAAGERQLRLSLPGP